MLNQGLISLFPSNFKGLSVGENSGWEKSEAGLQGLPDFPHLSQVSCESVVVSGSTFLAEQPKAFASPSQVGSRI